MKLKEEFILDCNNEYCNRNYPIIKSCQKQSKQERCYKKYIEKLEKQKIQSERQKEKQIEDFENNKEERLEKQKIYQEKQRQKQIEKFEKMLEEDNEIIIDEKEIEFRKNVWLMDCGFFPEVSYFSNWKKYCKIWNILTYEDRKYIDETYYMDLWIGQNLDVCHIQERSVQPELKYEPANGVVVSRYFHKLLDDYKHPVTKERITKEERLFWFQNAKLIKLENFKE